MFQQGQGSLSNPESLPFPQRRSEERVRTRRGALPAQVCEPHSLALLPPG